MTVTSFKLLSKGDHIPVGNWRIKEGLCVSRSLGVNGDFSIFGFWGENDVVLSIARNHCSDNPLEIVCVSQVIALEKIDISLCSQELIQGWHRLEQLLQITQVRPIGDRIYHLLKWFNERFGKDMQLTHQDIAATLNTTRVTVTRCLGDLEDEGKIRRIKRKVIFVG